MKKVFFVLPLTALVLSACSSHTPAPVVSAADSNELPPSVMRPVPGTGAMDNSYGWQTDVQTTAMPSTMNMPSYQPVPQPLPAPQPTYNAPQPIPQPVYTAPQPVPQPAPAPQPIKAEPKPAAVTPTSASQDFTIPRDANNAPIYSQIDKGFYNGNTYTVRKGDTMFLIAYITGKEVSEIAQMNNMSEPYQLHVGKVLKVGNGQPQQAVATTAPSAKVEPQVTYTSSANGTAVGSDGSVTGPVKAGTAATVTATAAPTVTASTAPRITASAASTTDNTPAPAVSSIKWQWPTQGRVISGFSSAEGGNKGIDIAGTKGQPVKAAAAGKVVYAGNALQGYGNLIIIKHNEDFLSAYAHNDTIKVEEQDTVKAGQTIATLGSSGTNSNKLHFEIRYHAKSVDPTRYLPKQ